MPDHEIYLIGDQPTTCPKCGARTHFDQFEEGQEMYQVHCCINPECGLAFIAVEN